MILGFKTSLRNSFNVILKVENLQMRYFPFFIFITLPLLFGQGNFFNSNFRSIFIFQRIAVFSVLYFSKKISSSEWGKFL